jgi:uncharacterized RmlC-like cupin family protein
MADRAGAERWREHGVRVVRGCDLDPDTPQTPGMSRAAAVDRARAGAEKLWAGTEIDATGEPLECVLVRSGADPVVVNLG